MGSAKLRSLIILLAAVGVSVSSCCREAPAQISIRESRQAYWSFPNAEIVGGQLVAPVDSRPKLDRVETTIRVETVVEYKFGQLRGRRLPSYERVTLDEVSKGVFKFKHGSPAGQYLLEYNAFDPDKGIASDEITVELKPIEPKPDDLLPEPDGLTVTSRESRRVMAEFVAGMARDMDTAATAVTDGKVKTVLELSSFTIPLDVATRNTFKKNMAPVVEPRLGSAALPADAAKTLQEVAAGFRSVK
jgi:hypothetical protein